MAVPARLSTFKSCVKLIERNTRCSISSGMLAFSGQQYHTSSSSNNQRGGNHQYEQQSNSNSTTMKKKLGKAGLLTSAAGLAYGIYMKIANDDGILGPVVEAATPMYTADDVSHHNSIENGIWVTLGNDVFDITEFVENHPGGKKILMAAGQSVEPFWETYTLHNSSEIKDMLYKMWIGKLNDDEKKKMALKSVKVGGNPYKNEPERDERYQVNSMQPFDAETPPSHIVKNFHTPNNLFYVRNHLPVPDIDPQTYRLNIEIAGDEPIQISLEDLKTKFKKYEFSATLQCAGNRRGEMSDHKPIYGAKAGFTAISNATWGGVLLKDVLKYFGLDHADDDDINHIHFEGLDRDMGGEHYGASIPAEKVFGAHEDILLAFEMNGEEIPKDHGYPIRVVIPGVIGARSVKWLGKIVASHEESKSFWQLLDYKCSPPSAQNHKYDFRDADPIYEMPVNSAVCVPENGSSVTVVNNEINVEGYAYSGGGRSILRVDVSVDDGKTWHTADLDQHDRNTYKNWAWTLWKVAIPVPAGSEKLHIMCKALDSHHNCQPESITSIWNLRGFLNNSWHKIEVDVNKST